MVPSCAAPVGVLPLATVSGCHSDRHEALPPGIIELAVQMKLPPRSADSVYKVMPLWLTSTLVPSLELFALCTVVLAEPPPPPPLVPAADIEPQPAASATAATSPASIPNRKFMISPRYRMCCCSHPSTARRERRDCVAACKPSTAVRRICEFVRWRIEFVSQPTWHLDNSGAIVFALAGGARLPNHGSKEPRRGRHARRGLRVTVTVLAVGLFTAAIS